MQELIRGYRKFRSERWPEERAHYEELAHGQSPQNLVIACSDSRVDPATVFSAGPGELFVIRNVANLVPPMEQGEGLHGTSAALEYAVTVLKVANIVVMGHGSCGGVTASLEGAPAGELFLSPWIKLLDEAKSRCQHCADPQTALERESVKVSLERLRGFPFVCEAIETRGLSLQGARFGIASGQLELLDPATGDFQPVK